MWKATVVFLWLKKRRRSLSCTVRACEVAGHSCRNTLIDSYMATKLDFGEFSFIICVLKSATAAFYFCKS